MMLLSYGVINVMVGLASSDQVYYERVFDDVRYHHYSPQYVDYEGDNNLNRRGIMINTQQLKLPKIKDSFFFSEPLEFNEHLPSYATNFEYLDSDDYLSINNYLPSYINNFEHDDFIPINKVLPSYLADFEYDDYLPSPNQLMDAISDPLFYPDFITGEDGFYYDDEWVVPLVVPLVVPFFHDKLPIKEYVPDFEPSFIPRPPSKKAKPNKSIINNEDTLNSDDESKSSVETIDANPSEPSIKLAEPQPTTSSQVKLNSESTIPDFVKLFPVSSKTKDNSQPSSKSVIETNLIAQQEPSTLNEITSSHQENLSSTTVDSNATISIMELNPTLSEESSTDKLPTTESNSLSTTKEMPSKTATSKEMPSKTATSKETPSKTANNESSTSDHGLLSMSSNNLSTITSSPTLTINKLITNNSNLSTDCQTTSSQFS